MLARSLASQIHGMHLHSLFTMNKLNDFDSIAGFSSLAISAAPLQILGVVVRRSRYQGPCTGLAVDDVQLLLGVY